MENTENPRSSLLIPAVLAILVLAIFGYLLFSDMQTKRTEHQVSPPIEIIETEPELIIIDDQAFTNEQLDQQEAEAFVNQLAVTTAGAPITIDEGDGQFVRHNSIITLPRTEQQTAEQSSIQADNPLLINNDNDKQALSVQQILQMEALADDTIFYLHRVTENDVQGLWGIIQSGLINKFRQGLQIEGISRNKELIQAIIPADADERLPSGLSSFLGTLLNNKVDSSYIYNLNTQIMGHDANLIRPGQQLIMVQFSPEELIQIYKFFSAERNKNTKTFAISH